MSLRSSQIKNYFKKLPEFRQRDDEKQIPKKLEKKNPSYLFPYEYELLNLDADTYLNVGSLLSLELFHKLGAGKNLIQAEPAEFPAQIFAAIETGFHSYNWEILSFTETSHGNRNRKYCFLLILSWVLRYIFLQCVYSTVVVYFCIIHFPCVYMVIY